MLDPKTEILVDALKIARNTMHRTILFNENGNVRNISEIEISVKIINEALERAGFSNE